MVNCLNIGCFLFIKEILKYSRIVEENIKLKIQFRVISLLLGESGKKGMLREGGGVKELGGRYLFYCVEQDRVLVKWFLGQSFGLEVQIFIQIDRKFGFIMVDLCYFVVFCYILL